MNCFEKNQEQRWYNLYLKLDQCEGKWEKVYRHGTEKREVTREH